MRAVAGRPRSLLGEGAALLEGPVRPGPKRQIAGDHGTFGRRRSVWSWEGRVNPSSRPGGHATSGLCRGSQTGQNAGKPRPPPPRIARDSGDSASLQKSRTHWAIASARRDREIVSSARLILVISKRVSDLSADPPDACSRAAGQLTRRDARLLQSPRSRTVAGGHALAAGFAQKQQRRRHWWVSIKAAVQKMLSARAPRRGLVAAQRAGHPDLADGTRLELL
jgi:hypothetical protein